MSSYKILDSSIFEENERWLINSLLSSKELKHSDKFETITLGEVLNERKETLNPQDNPDDLVNYLGLENVQSFTGFLVDFIPKKGKEIKSRCKVFKSGDLLYGRLRPSLRKSILIDFQIDDGICSTEFLVFKVDQELIDPISLRYLLSSEFVQNQIKTLIAGAALPRIQSKDFLSIKIPVFKNKMRKEFLTYCKKVDAEYRHYYKSLNSFEPNFNSKLNDAIHSGEFL